jgi:hypothetical protein
MTKLNYNRITHTFISGKASSTLIIPINIARKYGLDKPTDVIIEELSDGILVKKINLMGVLKC